MTGDVARARRSVRTWWGPTLAALSGSQVPSSSPRCRRLRSRRSCRADPDPAAQPNRRRVRLPARVRPIVHRAAGGADGGARATRGAVQGGRGGRRERAAAAGARRAAGGEPEAPGRNRGGADRAGELATGKQAAEARTAELTKTVEQATAKAREMDQELVAVRWQNAQLNTSLAQARTSGEQMEAEARTTQNALKNRIGSWRGRPSRRAAKQRACASRSRPASNASEWPSGRGPRPKHGWARCATR